MDPLTVAAERLAALYPDPETLLSGLEPPVDLPAGPPQARWVALLQRLRAQGRLSELSRAIARDEGIPAYEVQILSSALRRLAEEPPPGALLAQDALSGPASRSDLPPPGGLPAPRSLPAPGTRREDGAPSMRAGPAAGGEHEAAPRPRGGRRIPFPSVLVAVAAGLLIYLLALLWRMFA